MRGHRESLPELRADDRAPPARAAELGKEKATSRLTPSLAGPSSGHRPDLLASFTVNRVTNPSAVMRSRSVSVALSGLIAVGALSVASCAAPPAASQELASGHTPASRELSAEEQATHVLNRLAFGARPGDVGRVRAMGVDAWIARQLEPNRIDDRDMDRFLSHYETLGKSSAELYREYPPAAIARAAAARRDSLARDGRMTTADTLALLEQVRRSNVFLT